MKSSMRLIGLILFFYGTALACLKAQPTGKYYNMLQKSFVDHNAYETVAFVEQYWRIAGNKGFNESIYHVEKILQKAGYKKEVNGEADGPLTYRIETRKMKRPTWEPVSASLVLDGEVEPLLKSETNRNMIAINSAGTPLEGVTAEIVYVGKGTPDDFKDKDVNGKIVLAEGGANFIYNSATSKGAIGVLVYSMPSYTQPEKYTNSIQFQGIQYKDSLNQKWALVLSYQAKERIKEALKKGTVKATVKVSTKIYKADELTIVANARGTSKPDERFVFSAHVQEPGANDNATGVGTLAEMARVTAELIQQGKFSPQRTITFLWGDEIISTGRYITDDTERAKGIKWGLSLDMVGEDVTKTGGTFLIEKMPDPSAIWTRGEEKHTEWGGSVLKESEMFPHYFNDLLLNRCLEQAKENNWVVKTNPFEGGSDHTPFLKAKIPGLLMWHFTDVFYHTDGDRLTMVSETEMRNVGISGLATAYVLSSADEVLSLYLIEEVKKSAINRLMIEATLGKEAIRGGSKIAEEQHILDVWSGWYQEAIAKMNDINVGGPTQKITQSISAAKALVNKKCESLKKELDKSGSK